MEIKLIITKEIFCQVVNNLKAQFERDDNDRQLLCSFTRTDLEWFGSSNESVSAVILMIKAALTENQFILLQKYIYESDFGTKLNPGLELLHNLTPENIYDLIIATQEVK